MVKPTKLFMFALSNNNNYLTTSKIQKNMAKEKEINIFDSLFHLNKRNTKPVCDLLMQGLNINSRVPLYNRASGKVVATEAEQLFAYEIFKAFEVHISIEVEEQIEALRKKYMILKDYNEFEC